jgi:adenine-specific DNA-methyltransferase
MQITDYHAKYFAYARDKPRWKRNLLPRADKHNKGYKNPDGRSARTMDVGRPVCSDAYSAGIYPVTTPSGRIIAGPPKGMYWRVSKEKLLDLGKDGRIWWGADGDNVPRLKTILVRSDGEDRSADDLVT